MAKLKKLGKMSAHVGPNMTPMVDIVMCILIFFMLASSFAMPDLFLTNNTAISKAPGLGGETSNAPAPSVQSKIDARMVSGETWVTCFGATINGLGKRNDKGELIDEEPRKKLEDLLSSKQKDMSADAQVIIQPEKAVNYQDVITIYDACMKAHFKNVAFATAK